MWPAPANGLRLGISQQKYRCFHRQARRQNSGVCAGSGIFTVRKCGLRIPNCILHGRRNCLASVAMRFFWTTWINRRIACRAAISSAEAWKTKPANHRFLIGRFRQTGCGWHGAGIGCVRSGVRCGFRPGSRVGLARNIAAAVPCWNSTSLTTVICTASIVTVPSVRHRKPCICQSKNCGCGSMNGWLMVNDGGVFASWAANQPCIPNSVKSWPSFFGIVSGHRKR